jgi:hypothetical protein
MAKGAYGAGREIVTGTASAVVHPVETAKGLATAARHPITTGKAVISGAAGELRNYSSAIQRGDGRAAGESLGRIYTNVGTALIPEARLGRASEVGRTVAKAGEVSARGEVGFSSFSAFKRAAGPAGPKQDWHHIVPQHADNVKRFGAETIHSSSNLVKLPREVHQKINAYYNSKLNFSAPLTVRDWLKTQPFDKQKAFGDQVIAKFYKKP